MSYEELEQRVHVLEEQVARLTGQENGPAKPSAPERKELAFTEDDILEGVDFDIVLNVPPIAEYVVKANVIGVEYGPQRLALTDEEWKLYGGEHDE